MAKAKKALDPVKTSTEVATYEHTAAHAALISVYRKLEIDSLFDTAGKLLAFRDEADKAVDVAARLEVTDQASYDAATTFGVSVAAVMKDVEKSRKALTSPLDAAKKAITALFAIPGDRLEAAKTAVSRKMMAWMAEERSRREAAALAERQAREEEARKLAEATAAMGDAAGAQQIIEEAAALPVVETKVSGTGMYGGSAGTVKRAQGSVSHQINFLRWLLDSAPPTNEVMAVIESIQFGQVRLNALAKITLEAGETIPGFEATYAENLSFRS